MATSLQTVPLKVIKNFTIEALIGEGSFGKVYEASSNEKSKVAIKKIQKNSLNKQMQECVKNEIEIHQSLDHPSIVKFIAAFKTEEHIYIVTELCTTDLSKKLTEEKEFFNFQRIKKMMMQIVNGLVYLKDEHGIIHRDLKLSNLLLDKRNDIKIADFGMAVYVLPKTQHRTVCGTFGFMAKEVMEREPQGFESDLWSLGCVLYAMFEGKSPFESRDQKKTIDNTINVQFNFSAQVPDAAKDLITSLIKENPEKRIKLHDVLKHDFLVNYKKQSRGDSSTNSSNISGSQSFNNDSLPQKRLHRQMSVDNLTESSRIHGLPSRCNLLHPDRGKPPSSYTKHRLQYSKTGSLTLQNPNYGVSSFDSGIPLSEYSSKKLDVSKLVNCKRLKCMRRSLKYGMFTIMKRNDNNTNEVYFEPWFNGSDESHVEHLLKISEDGRKITSYVFKEPIDILPDQPIDVPPRCTIKEFRFDENLPNQIRKFYKYISDKVYMLQSATPKITCYDDDDACYKSMLMENLDFVAQFVDGAVIKKEMGKTTWKLKELEDSADWREFAEGELRTRMPSKMKCALEKFEFVVQEERLHSRYEKQHFPIVFGRKQSFDQTREISKIQSVISRCNDSGFQSNRSNMSSINTKHLASSSYR